MKEIDGWVKIKKYTDDEGKPVCGDCIANSAETWCQHQTLEEPYRPKNTCPVWHGESKSECDPMVYLLALMDALEIPHPEWWLTKPPVFLVECGIAIKNQAKKEQEK